MLGSKHDARRYYIASHMAHDREKHAMANIHRMITTLRHLSTAHGEYEGHVRLDMDQGIMAGFLGFRG